MGLYFTCLILNDGSDAVSSANAAAVDPSKTESAGNYLNVAANTPQNLGLANAYVESRANPNCYAVGLFDSWGIVLGIDLTGHFGIELTTCLRQIASLYRSPHSCLATYDESSGSYGAMYFESATVKRSFWVDLSEQQLLVDFGEWLPVETAVIARERLDPADRFTCYQSCADELVMAVTSLVIDESFFAFDWPVSTYAYRKAGANPFNINWLKRFWTYTE